MTRERLIRTTQARGQVVFPVQMHLTSPESGAAALLQVAEGDRVTAGQALAEVSAPDLIQALDDLRAELAAAEGSLGQQRLNLPSDRGSEIMALLEGLNRSGVTLVTVTHDDAMGRRARRRVRLLDGRIVEDRPLPAAGARP